MCNEGKYDVIRVVESYSRGGGAKREKLKFVSSNFNFKYAEV